MEAVRPRKFHEGALLFLILFALAATLAGVLLVFFPGLPLGEAGAGLLLLGILTMAASYPVSFDVETLRWAVRAKAANTRAVQVRRWTRLKVGVIFLSLMAMFASFVLGIAVLGRLGMVSLDTQALTLRRILGIELLAMAVAVSYAHYHSLHVRLDREKDSARRTYTILGAGLAALVGIAGFVADGNGLGPLRPGDGPWVSLASLTLLALMLFLARGLPTPYHIFGQDRNLTQGSTYYSRSKSVVMPTVIAFSLLFLLLLVFLVAGAGIVAVVEEALQSVAVLVLLGLLSLAVLGSIVVALYLARQEDRPVLYQQARSREEKTELWVLGISFSLAVAAFVLAVMVGVVRPVLGIPQHRWLEIVTIGLLILIGPYGIYKSREARHVRRLEERFPDFLRDLASSHRGGLTLSSSVFVAAKGDYGELSPDIQKFADQLSWNISFEEALERFGERVRTPLVQRTVSLITEANRSGGSTSDVLLAAGRDAREIKQLEAQRRLSMSLYTSVIYITFFVFLTVVGVMNMQFVPEIIAASSAAIDQGATGVGGINFDTPTAQQFRTFYFLAAVVQGLGDGIVAGMMGTGRFSLGLRHSFIMVAISLVVFVFWF